MDTSSSAPWWLYFVAVLFLISYAFVQFNRWTDDELKADDILSVAPPKHFTSFSRFSSMAVLYCISLLAFYAVLVAVFLHKEWSEGILKVAGVTQANAWLAALFAITGLSNVVPPFKTVESLVRRTLHRWAFVPMKAKSLASQITDPSTTFELDDAYIEKVAMVQAGKSFVRSDFVTGHAITIANKWCRLVYLLNKIAPRKSLSGARLWSTKSPYTTKFDQAFEKLEKTAQDLAGRGEAGLRETPTSPEALHLSDRIEDLLGDLYLLMSCQALGSKLSWDAVQTHFRSVYGINVSASSNVPIPSSSIFNALALVGVATFLTAGAYKLWTNDAEVAPLVWALSALGVHGVASGLVGLFTDFVEELSEGRPTASGAVDSEAIILASLQFSASLLQLRRVG